MEKMFGIQARVGMEVRGERQNFKKNACWANKCGHMGFENNNR